jgi:hypothetical protein
MAIADGVKTLLAAISNPSVEERVKAGNTQPDSEAKALEKARIIKEEIAKHHGETDEQAGKRRMTKIGSLGGLAIVADTDTLQQAQAKKG